MSTINKISSLMERLPQTYKLLVAAGLFQLLSTNAQGQISLSPNSQLHIQKNATMYVPGVQVDSGAIHGKGSIVNKGNWEANTPVMNNTDSITTNFEGLVQQIVQGSVAPNMHKVQVNNPAGLKLASTLTTEMQVRDTLKMIQGIVDLNGKYINFGFTGTLDENDTSYVFDNVNSGGVKASAVLNNPIDANPANLGLEITGGGNMDTTHIVRKHMEEIPSAGSYLSYTVNPKNQPTSNVTATIFYRPHHTQVGMGDPAQYDIHRNDAGVWSPTGGASDVVNSAVSVVLIDGFKDGLTIANLGDPLAVTVVSFSSACENGHTVLNWKTLSEQDSNRFEIQRSLDGVVWETIGEVPAAGNSNQPIDYTFKDPDQLGDGGVYYYRFVEHDNDGNQTPHTIIASNCVSPDIASIVAFPNPTVGGLTLQLQASQYKDMPLEIVDMSGRLVYSQDIHTIYGIIQHHVNLSHLADGVYILRAGDEKIRIVLTK